MIVKPIHASLLPIKALPHDVPPWTVEIHEALFQEEHDCIMNDYFQGCQPFPFGKDYPRSLFFSMIRGRGRFFCSYPCPVHREGAGWIDLNFA